MVQQSLKHGLFQFEWFRKPDLVLRDDFLDSQSEPKPEPISYGRLGFTFGATDGPWPHQTELWGERCMLTAERAKLGPGYFPLEQAPRLHRRFAKLADDASV